MSDAREVDSFEVFFHRAEPRLRQALSAALGSTAGRDSAADALSYAWENWERVRRMENPIGYLFVVGRDRARPHTWRRPALMPVDRVATPWVEPDLPDALAELPDQQRVVVMLLHCFQWTMSEVAELLDVSKATVQTHSDRALRRLRSRLGVAQ